MYAGKMSVEASCAKREEKWKRREEKKFVYNSLLNTYIGKKCTYITSMFFQGRVNHFILRRFQKPKTLPLYNVNADL